MLHVIKQIQRHFPKHRAKVVPVLFALSASALLVGVGLLLLTP
jgi:hypothetical protein